MASSLKMENVGADEISSFASLIRTFLPDHSDLPFPETREKLLQSAGGRGSQTQAKSNSKRAENDKANPSQSKLPEAKQSFAEKLHNFADRTEPGLEKADVLSSLERVRDDDEDSNATIELPPITMAQVGQSPPPSEIISTEKFRAASLSGQDIPDDCMKQYACFLCDQNFPDVVVYTEHMETHCQEVASINCLDCGETFSSRTSYNSHRKLSTYEIWKERIPGKDPVKIDEDATDDGGGSPKTEVRKKVTIDGMDPGSSESFYCIVCGKSIIKYLSYLKHMRTHKEEQAFKCSVCHEIFKAPCMLRYHIDLQHSHVLPFQCQRCLRRFKLRSSMSTHLKFCDIDPTMLPFAEEMQYIDQLSQQRKYQSLQGLEDDGMAQYSCPICMVMCDSPQELQSHMNHHDETKPYKCEECGRGFRSKRMLQKHSTLHQSEHDCRCEICGVQLLTLSGYNAHLRGHRNQELIQAQFFNDSNSAPSGENVTSEPALEILQKMREKNKAEVKAAEAEKKRMEAENIPRHGGSSKKEKKYPCPICGMLFHSGGEKFQIHARREHKDAPFEDCSLCKRSYLGKDNLARHLKLHKLYSETFPCDECGKTFRRKYALIVHKKMHSFKKFVKCDICGQEFRFVSEVDKHKNTKHRYDRMLNIYKCNICGQRFPMLSHLSVHCYCHNVPDSKPFECDLCKVSYKTSIELKQHIYQKHDELMKKLGGSTYVPDSGTFFTFADTSASGFDNVNIKQEKMDHDGKESAAELESIKSKLKSPSDLILPPEGLLIGKRPAVKSEGSQGNGDVKEGKGKEFTEEEVSLLSNVEAYNTATRNFSHKAKILKRYSCEVCQKAFASNSDLKTHRRTHSGETPFKCDFCDRSFKQRGHRKLHIQVVHTKEMPYKCDQCDSAFPTRYRYQVHRKRHAGFKEHCCAYCQKEFYTLGKLNEHKKKRHPEEWKKEQRQLQKD